MIFKLFYFLLLGMSSSVLAFNPDFKTISGRTPHEFDLLFETLKSESKMPSNQLIMIGLCKDINEGMKTLAPEHIYILMKTEVTKGTLQHSFKKARQFDFNDMLVERVQKAVVSKQEKYSRFANWIAQSILAELKLRQSNGIISAKSFNPNLYNGEKKNEAIRFQRYLKYLNPWIERILNDGPEDFNKLSRIVSLEILGNINSRAQLFKKFSPSNASATATNVINIPQKLLDLSPEQIKDMQNDRPAPEATLSEQSKKEKLEAAKEIEKVTPLDMSPISEDVARELESEEKKETPKAP